MHATAATFKAARAGLVSMVFLLFVAALLLRGEKLGDLKEPFEYPAFAIDEDRIYVWDRYCVVHVYGRKDFVHLGQFGRKGQGPAEFQFIAYLHVLPDRLCIGQGQKISYFSKKGEFLETITYPNPDTGTYMPVGSNFVGTRYLPSDPKDKLTTLAVGLYDSKFKPVKEVYRAEVHKSTVYNFEKEKMDVLYVRDCFKYEVCDDRLYLGNSRAGFFFGVFDSRGEKLYDISRSHKPIKISSGDIKKMMAEFREAIGEQEFERRKNLVNQYIFPEFYPAYANFSVVGGKIYVFSYPIPDRPMVVTILDLRGRLLREREVSLSGPYRASGGQSYTIDKGRYYYMLYNEESDKWELHVENLD